MWAFCTKRPFLRSCALHRHLELDAGTYGRVPNLFNGPIALLLQQLHYFAFALDVKNMVLHTPFHSSFNFRKSHGFFV